MPGILSLCAVSSGYLLAGCWLGLLVWPGHWTEKLFFSVWNFNMGLYWVDATNTVRKPSLGENDPDTLFPGQNIDDFITTVLGSRSLHSQRDRLCNIGALVPKMLSEFCTRWDRLVLGSYWMLILGGLACVCYATASTSLYYYYAVSKRKKVRQLTKAMFFAANILAGLGLLGYTYASIGMRDWPVPAFGLAADTFAGGGCYILAVILWLISIWATTFVFMRAFRAHRMEEYLNEEMSLEKKEMMREQLQAFSAQLASSGAEYYASYDAWGAATWGAPTASTYGGDSTWSAPPTAATWDSGGSAPPTAPPTATGGGGDGTWGGGGPGGGGDGTWSQPAPGPPRWSPTAGMPQLPQ